MSLGNQTAASGGGAVGLGSGGLNAAGGTAVTSATTAGLASPLGSTAASVQTAAGNTAAVSFLHDDGAALSANTNAAGAFGAHTNIPSVVPNADAHTNVAAGGNADFLGNEATTLGAHSAVQAGGATSAEVAGGHTSFGGNVAAQNNFGTHADILGHDTAALESHGNVNTGAAATAQGSTGQGSVIHTGGSTAANGDVAAGSHGGSMITGSQGSANAGTTSSVGSSHASTNVDQHAAMDSLTHAVTGTPDHSAFDPSAHVAADSSSHSLFDAGHDPSASHIPQFGAEAATHNQFDQHLGF